MDISRKTDVGIGLTVDSLVGACDEIFGFVGDGGCCFGKTEIVTLVVVLLLLHEGQPLEVAGSVD